jgi:predicted metalloendopeptidase
MTEWQVMRDRTEAQLRGLIEAAAASAPHEPTTVEGKVGAFYKSFMGEPTRPTNKTEIGCHLL